MPRDLFEEAGIAPEQSTQPRDLFKDAKIKVPGPTNDSERYGLFEKIPKAGYSFLTGAAQGAVDLGTMPGNLLAKGINMAAGKPIAPIADIDLASNQIGGHPEYATPQVLGEMTPLALAPLGEFSMFSKLLSKGPKAINGLRSARLGAKVADIGTTGGLYAEAFNANNPYDGLGEDFKKGALTNLALTPIFRALPAIQQRSIDKLRKDAYNGGMGMRTPEEVANISSMIGDLPVDFGTLVNAPTTKDIYKNWVSAIPGSGVKPRMQKVVAETDKEAKKILNYYLGDSLPENIGKEFRSELDTLKKDAKKESSQNYETFFREAKQQDLDINQRPRLKKVSESLLKQIEKKNKTGDLHPLNTSRDISILEKFTKGAGGFKEKEGQLYDSLGNKIISKEKIPDREIRDATDTYSELGRMERELYQAGDEKKSRYYTLLRKAMSADIEETLKKANRPDLYKKWIDANSFYQNRYIPYAEPKINAFINGLTSSKKAHTLLDDHELYPQVLNDISDKTLKKLIYQKMASKLSQDERGQLKARPYLLSNTYDKLEPSFREKFMNNDEIYSFNRLNALDSFAKEYRPVLNTPQTGALQKNLSIAGKALAFPAVAAFAGYHTSEEHQARNALIASMLGLSLSPVSRMYAARMTSPKLREAYISGKFPKYKNLKKAENLARKSIISMETD